MQRFLLRLLVSRNRSVALHDLLPQLVLVLYLTPGPNACLLSLAHQLFHLAVIFDELAQLLPVAFKGQLLTVCLDLEHRHFLLRPISHLVGYVGQLNDFRHLRLLLIQVLFELFVNVVKRLSLAP